jgi:hypothetical protein
MTWREKVAPIIARVLEETRGQSEAEIKAALKAAYPSQPRFSPNHRLTTNQ